MAEEGHDVAVAAAMCIYTVANRNKKKKT